METAANATIKFLASDKPVPILFWYDYLSILVLFTLSSGFGVYYGCFGSKQATAREYLLGGKEMRVIPVTVSLLIRYVECNKFFFFSFTNLFMK